MMNSNAILVIDDDQLALSKVRELLSKNGYTVFTAGSSKDALRLLQKKKISLVITDILIDKITGLDILSTVKNKYFSTMVMILTGHEESLYILQALRLGADEYITKPFEPEEFLFKVKNCLERNTSRNEYIRLAAAVQQLAEILIISSREGKILYVNDAFTKISGYPKEKILGSSIFSLDFRQQLDTEEKLGFRETLKIGKVWKGIYTNQRKNGSFYETEATTSPVFDESGSIVNIVTVERDVTHVRELERQVRQSQKMEALGTLASGIAHDFNNILGAIMGYTEMSMENVPVGSYIHSNLKQILKSSNRASNLISQILAFSRAKKQEKKPVKIAVFILEALKMLRSTLPRSIDLKQKIKDRDATVLSDPTQLHQILINLCTNAAQAMPEDGGVISVAGKVIDFSKEQGAGCYFSEKIKSGIYYYLQVLDNGSGMEAWVLERIFDPFFTTKKAGDGTGLGLSLVHSLVKEHRGEIFVQSMPGEGTSVQLLFPLSTMVSSQDTMVSSEVTSGKGKILIVDDEKSLVEIIKQMLESLGYETVGFTDSRKALRNFQEDQSIDLVLLDQAMPHYTGIRLAEEMLAVRKDIPIVLTTGYMDAISEDDLREKGIRKIIYKPVRRRDLAMIVFELLTR